MNISLRKRKDQQQLGLPRKLNCVRSGGGSPKLLQAHYADHISEALFAEEQTRIRQERVAAEQRIDGLSIEHEQVLKALDLALAMTDNIQAAYIQAGPRNAAC